MYSLKSYFMLDSQLSNHLNILSDIMFNVLRMYLLISQCDIV